MENSSMFCFQCEQTAGCSGCKKDRGVCGKSSDTANMQDKLTGALVVLAKSMEGQEDRADDKTFDLLMESLFTTVTNVSFSTEGAKVLLQKVMEESNRIASGNAIYTEEDIYDLELVWNDNEDIRSLKSLLLFGIRGMAAYAYHAAVLGYRDNKVYTFMLKALRHIAMNNPTADVLLPVVLELGEVNLKCMALLDKANTESFGTPVPTEVSLTIEKGPFIVITGHDLEDLKLLLEQTKDTGVNVYTHGEMLPAHGYPELKKYPHLKGNFGTAWQNQQKEFDNIPAPILYTSNCIMPPKNSYIDRIFTTAVVDFPGTVHIDSKKDFSEVIERAKQLGGYENDRECTGINGGHTVTTGFGHGTVLANAHAIIEAVKQGAIKHFYLVGGCDGAKKDRNYFTEFVKNTPADTIILTLGCGKYRFNDMDLGKIGDFPRILDMGQCNDAYGAIQVAVALADAFGCGVNELPLSLVISWYEQKAVCVLLTLLHLGIKNILLGPSLPAFISPNVLDILVKNYNIGAIKP